MKNSLRLPFVLHHRELWQAILALPEFYKCPGFSAVLQMSTAMGMKTLASLCGNYGLWSTHLLHFTSQRSDMLLSSCQLLLHLHQVERLLVDDRHQLLRRLMLVPSNGGRRDQVSCFLPNQMASLTLPVSAPCSRLSASRSRSSALRSPPYPPLIEGDSSPPAC